MKQTNSVQQKSEPQNKYIINGIDVDSLFRTIEAIKQKPEIAKFNFKAKGKWINGGHNRTQINEYYGACKNFKRSQPFIFEKDEPPILLGEDHGANPVEYVLAAIDGCLTTSLIYHAAALGINIEEVETLFSGDINLHGFLGLDESIRNGYEKIKVTFNIKADTSKEELQKLIQLAQERSPVFDIITHPTPIEVRLGEGTQNIKN